MYDKGYCKQSFIWRNIMGFFQKLFSIKPDNKIDLEKIDIDANEYKNKIRKEMLLRVSNPDIEIRKECYSFIETDILPVIIHSQLTIENRLDAKRIVEKLIKESRAPETDYEKLIFDEVMDLFARNNILGMASKIGII